MYFLLWVEVMRGLFYHAEGTPNKPLQNMPLWHIGYFEPQALEKQQAEGQAFFELLFCLRTDPAEGTQLT